MLSTRCFWHPRQHWHTFTRAEVEQPALQGWSPGMIMARGAARLGAQSVCCAFTTVRAQIGLLGAQVTCTVGQRSYKDRRL